MEFVLPAGEQEEVLGQGCGVSQNEAILAHMEGGDTITPAEAYALYGCLALHSRIAELRRKGYRIDGEMHSDGKRRWGEYWIAIPH